MYKNIKGEVREGKGRGKSCFFFGFCFFFVCLFLATAGIRA